MNSHSSKSLVRAFFTPALLALSISSAGLLLSTSANAVGIAPAANTIAAISANTPYPEANKQSHAEIALLQPQRYRENPDNLPFRANTFKDTLLPLITWILGSAVLAMIGYKRMRNSSTGTD